MRALGVWAAARAIAACVSLCVPALALAQDTPPLPTGTDTVGGDAATWHGLSRLHGIVRGLGWQVQTPNELDLGDLGLGDILVVIAPTPSLDANEMISFIEAGGSLLLADEAAGSDLWQRLGLVAVNETSIVAATYWQNLSWAPIAQPFLATPVTQGVNEVVANYPLAFASDRRNVLGFGDNLGLVAVGNRGLGRYVAFADASLLINRMLEFAGNARLAANTLRYLSRPETTRVIIVAQEFSTIGSLNRADDVRSPYDRSLASLNRWLGDRREWMLTPMALYAGIGLALAALAMLAFFTMWKRDRLAHAQLSATMARSTRPALDQSLDHAGVPRSPNDILAAAIWLRDEIEDVIAQRLGVAHALSFEHPAAMAALQGQNPAAARMLARAISLTRHLPGRYTSPAGRVHATFSRRSLRTLLALRSELFNAMGERIAP